MNDDTPIKVSFKVPNMYFVLVMMAAAEPRGLSIGDGFSAESQDRDLKSYSSQAEELSCVLSG